jgi:hypothetical protein
MSRSAILPSEESGSFSSKLPLSIDRLLAAGEAA